MTAAGLLGIASLVTVTSSSTRNHHLRSFVRFVSFAIAAICFSLIIRSFSFCFAANDMCSTLAMICFEESCNVLPILM
uniref:Uncharacterized protein n=1 Tax=Anopheles darlingi TaxID=43151 RepID=A0A2M4DI89_ANODA